MTPYDHSDTATLRRRMRHVLSTFRRIAAHMATRSADHQESVQHLAGRISAIGRAALASHAHGLDLESLLLDELLAHGRRGQFLIEGPGVQLHGHPAQLMSLAIHELATNALKYGALSQPDAELLVRWRHSEHSGSQRLWFEWIEEGVRMTAGAPRTVGFGSDLIERLIARDLRGHGEMLFLPGGVRCIIEIPLSETPNKDE
jgi:two-component system, chemotaxis family, CheB/CheR fusion protein